MNGREVCQRAEVGDRQRAILMRATRGILIAQDNAEQCAARRLVRRGILRPYRLGGPDTGYLTIYKVVAQ